MNYYFAFPVVDYDEDDPENSPVSQEEGGIVPIRIDKEPYEIDLYAGGETYHLVFGHCIDGCFLCIPERKLGCGLEALDDVSWNMHVLLDTDVLDYEECTAISMGLAYISRIINHQ